MILTVWRLLTRQIDTNPAQDDAALREACTQARYGTDDGPARKAVAATRFDHDRRARYVRVHPSGPVKPTAPVNSLLSGGAVYSFNYLAC